MAGDVRDAAFFASIISSRPALGVADETITPRVGLYRTECWHLAGPATATALDRAMAALSARGATVEEIPLVAGYDELLPIHDGVMGWDMLQGLCFERLFRRDAVAPKTIEMFKMREGATPEAYDRAQIRAREARTGIERLFGEFDVLLAPSAPGEAPEGLESTGDASFNRGWTMLHVPCVSVPAGTGPAGLPIGVQIVGRIGEDAKTLSAAAFLEDALAAF
jgi:amidase